MKKVVKIHEKNPAFLLSLLPLLSIANSDDIVSRPRMFIPKNLLFLAFQHSQSCWSCCRRQESWWWLYSGKISTKISHRGAPLGLPEYFEYLEKSEFDISDTEDDFNLDAFLNSNLTDLVKKAVEPVMADFIAKGTPEAVRCFSLEM